MQVYRAYFFSIWPPVAVNIHYFLFHAIDGLGGGYRRNTRLLLRVIGYRRERGTYRQLSYAQALKKLDWVPKRGSYHPTTATSVRGSHGQTTRRAPPEAADGRKTSRGGRSRQGTPGEELAGSSQGRLPSIRSHGRLYGGQSAHIRSWQSRMNPCSEDGRWSAVAQGRGCCRERKNS